MEGASELSCHLPDAAGVLSGLAIGGGPADLDRCRAPARQAAIRAMTGPCVRPTDEHPGTQEG